MKSQLIFYEKKKKMKKIGMSSAAISLGALMVNCGKPFALLA